MKYTEAEINSVLSEEEKKSGLFEVVRERKGWFRYEHVIEAYERVIGERLDAKKAWQAQELRRVAAQAMIATGMNDPVVAIEMLLLEHSQMREGIYKTAPPREFKGGLPCASEERDKYLMQFGIIDTGVFGMCCNG